MKLEDEIRGVLGDYITDPDEREGILNNIIYYTRYYSRGVFAGGVAVGMILMGFLLKYLS